MVSQIHRKDDHCRVARISQTDTKWEPTPGWRYHEIQIDEHRTASLAHLLTGKPRPNTPAEPDCTTFVFVSEIAARYWF